MTSVAENSAVITLDGFIRIARQFRQQHGASFSGVKMSKLTCHLLATSLPVIQDSQQWQTIYGIPILEDNTIPFGEYELAP